MAFLHIKNVVLRGVAACIPARVEENTDLAHMTAPDIEKLVATTGIERRHIVNTGTCTSDLCLKAAEQLINELKWDTKEIEALIFVSQTPDYILPATSCLLQDRLGLPADCISLDISLGCSGFVYGLSTLASYMQTGMIKKALLLAGDTSSLTCSKKDKSTYPLFGDAGTVTALEFSEGADGFKFHLGCDGSGSNAIIINDGGYRNPFNSESLTTSDIAEGISRSKLHLALDGMDVFSFGISMAPETVNALLRRFNIDKEKIDFFYFHQANKMMNERIRKKLLLPEHKVPLSLRQFGNTSSASIPLTMVTQTAKALSSGENEVLACGFGVGLSWGTVCFTAKYLTIPELIYYD